MSDISVIKKGDLYLVKKSYEFNGNIRTIMTDFTKEEIDRLKIELEKIR